MGLGYLLGDRTSRHDLQFAERVILVWILLALGIGLYSGSDLAVCADFILGSSLIAYTTLKICGYFDPLRIISRRSDVVLIITSFSLAAFSQELILRHLFAVSFATPKSLLTLTLIMAAFVFANFFALLHYRLRRGSRRLMILDVLPEERRALEELLQAYGLAVQVELRDAQSLPKLLLEGRQREIALIVISQHPVKHFDANAVLIRAHLAGVPVVDFRKLESRLSGRIDLSDADLWSYIINATPQTLALRAFSRLKVLSEPIVAAVLGVLLLPVMVVIALLVKYSSPGPVLYRQVRTGYLGKTFTLLKFRSMGMNAELNGPQWATTNDCRVTPVGKFLRATRLDELPQLWNVITGEMGFFGPRPERPEIYAQLRKEIPLFAMRTVVRPGLTGWAQICSGYAASVEASIRKLEYDLYYIQNMSPRLDLIILIKTLMVVIAGPAAHREKTLPSKADRSGRYPAVSGLESVVGS